MNMIIVGAGIAGMSAGIYARQSGYDVTIFESHSIAGGNSTSWKRKGYLFEGGMHWLIGSAEHIPLHKIWKEVGALQSNNPIYYRDPFLTYRNNGNAISLYRDTEKLRQELLSISPQDAQAINQLIRDIKVLKKVAMPIMNIRGVKVKYKSAMPLSLLFACMKAKRTMDRLGKLTIQEYVTQFQHQGIRESLSAVVSMGEYSAMSLLITLGSLAEMDGGYPKGGSLLMAQNMAQTFVSLGGIIKYNQCVERVNVEDAKANGVWIDGTLHAADAVIVSTDTLCAIDHLFTHPLQEPWMEELRREIIPVNCTFLAFGISKDLSHYPENMVASLEEPLFYAGKQHHYLMINNYASFDGYAPEGCTPLTIMLFEDTYDEWKEAAAAGIYEEKKQALAELLIEKLEQAMPEIKDHVEVLDIATPLTYERYCGTYRGSWMSLMKPNLKRQAYPCRSDQIKNLYFAGQRLMVPGGLPVAVSSGRTAVQHACKDAGIVFQGKDEVNQ